MIVYFKLRQNTFGANKLFSHITSKVMLYIRMENIYVLEQRLGTCGSLRYSSTLNRKIQINLIIILLYFKLKPKKNVTC